MLPDSITLAVDEEGDGDPIVNHVFDRHDVYQNRSVYNGPDHAIAKRYTLGFYRTYPKQNGNFRGTSKCSLKLTKDFEVDGVDGDTSIIVPSIIEVSCSFPVGLTDAETLELRETVAAALRLHTVTGPLCNTLTI